MKHFFIVQHRNKYYIGQDSLGQFNAAAMEDAFKYHDKESARKGIIKKVKWSKTNNKDYIIYEVTIKKHKRAGQR